MLPDLNEPDVGFQFICLVFLAFFGYGIDTLYVTATEHRDPTGKLGDADQGSIVSDLRTWITSFPLPRLLAERTEAHEMSEPPPGPQNTGNFQTWFSRMVGVMQLIFYQLHIHIL